jgi:hypothetical protein
MNAASVINRVLFLGAGLLFVFAIAEKIANAAGYTIINQAYAPGRLLEFAAIMVLFVVALLLREIRDDGRRAAGR